jgi:hypothetical protein
MPKRTHRHIRKRKVKRHITKKRGGMDPPPNSSNSVRNRPSDYELYGIDDSTPVRNKELHETDKQKLSGWFESILTAPNFKASVYIRISKHKLFPDTNASDAGNASDSKNNAEAEKFPIEITEEDRDLIIKCALELFDVVYTFFGGRILPRNIQTIGSACFIIAVQSLYGYDYIGDNWLYAYMQDANKSYNPPIKKKIWLRLLVSNILEKTNWKGCHTFLLHKNNNNAGNMRSHTSTCGINANGKGCTCRAP